MKKILLTISVITISQSTLSYEDKCSRNRSYENRAISKCIGGTLPQSRMRNIRENSHEIVCSGNADSYVRRPQKLDMDKWEELVAYNKQEAQDFAWKTLPEIAWSGTTTFNTVEKWTWESCDLVTSGFECGYDTEYEQVQVSYYDSNNQLQYKTETQEVEVPKSCYVDISHTEYEICSTELMNYSAKFNRPDKKSWNPSVENYYDQLPLKYDLLPGETEVIQTFSTRDSYTSTLNPKAVIPNGWNQYQINMQGSNFKCDQLKAKGIAPYEFSAEINTIKRDTGKKSPNAFKLPVDFDGSPLEVISWANGMGADGVNYDQAYPRGVQLIDTAASMISMVAQQSRQNEDYAKAKHEQGKFTNSDGVEISDKQSKSFFKNTKVKVAIVDKNNYWFDNQFGKIYTDDVKSTQASLNVLSEDQTIARSELWFLSLDGNREGIDDIYSSWNLKPNKDDYVIEVSMYQKDTPFYNQSCENDKSPPMWACNKIVRWLGMGRQERDFYSEPLSIPLETSGYDKRGFFKKIVNFFGYR